MTREPPGTDSGRIWDSPADEMWNVIAELSAHEATKLFTNGTMGRIAVDAPGGPLVFPVKYEYLSPYAVIRTALPEELEAVTRSHVTLQADDIDIDNQWAWSVVAKGWASDISKSMDPASEEMQTRTMSSWVPVTDDLRFRIEIKDVRGWRFGRAPLPRPRSLEEWNGSSGAEHGEDVGPARDELSD